MVPYVGTTSSVSQAAPHLVSCVNCFVILKCRHGIVRGPTLLRDWRKRGISMSCDNLRWHLSFLPSLKGELQGLKLGLPVLQVMRFRVFLSFLMLRPV